MPPFLQEFLKIRLHPRTILASTVKLGDSNIGFCDTLSIASNIQWYALIPHKAYSFITTLFLVPFDDVITKFYFSCIRQTLTKVCVCWNCVSLILIRTNLKCVCVGGGIARITPPVADMYKLLSSLLCNAPHHTDIYAGGLNLCKLRNVTLSAAVATALP
jgi:hypothetical protein